MQDIKIVIVDDSPFSVSILSDILKDAGFNVIGDASNLKETIDVVKELKPDIVTMDMTLPGTDGIECTRAIHEIDPNIKVIIVSSMKDEEIISKAKKENVVGYVQKPVDPDEITILIKRIFDNEELYKELEDIYEDIFTEALSETINRLVKEAPTFEKKEILKEEHINKGISVVIGIIGKYTGRGVFNMSYETAEKFAKAALKRDTKNLDEVLNVMSEFTNIVSGNACSVINRKNKLFGLRVAPPTVIHGESINISKAELETMAATIASTTYGDIYSNIGFKRGNGEWTSNI